MDRIHKLTKTVTIADSVASNKSKLDSIRSAIESWLASPSTLSEIRRAAEDAPADDLFFVRFIISFPENDVEDLLEKVKRTLEWRGKNGELLKQVAEGGCPAMAKMDSYMCRGYLGDFGNCAFFAERHGHNDIPHLADFVKHYSSPETSPLTLRDAFLIMSEYAFRIVDRLSRKTGNICKVVNLCFLENIPMTPNSNVMKIVYAVGAASKMSSVYYPQLLGAAVMFSAESRMANLVIKVCRPFISEKTLSKVIFCKGYKKGSIPPDACPALRMLESKLDWSSVFPHFANGNATTPISLLSRRVKEEQSLVVGSQPG